MADDHTQSELPIDRRRLLQGITAAGVVGIAGCLGGNGDEDPEPIDPSDALEYETVDPADIQEGGTLEVGLQANPVSFDPPYSTEAPATLVQNLFFESLIATDIEGNVYPWLARSYELVETNDIDRMAYEEYMVEIPYDDEGTPETEDQIVITHPDNDPDDGEGLFLTVNETQDAVDDGTFGMQFRYELHEGVTFHDGHELTADDVVNSYRRYENSDVSGQTFDQFLHAEAVDDYTVDLYGQIPDAEAERDLPVLVFHPDQVDLDDGDLDPRNGNEPIGTGAWVFEEFDDENYLVVTRNEDYWVDLDEFEWWDGPADFPNAPVIDEIDMEFIGDDSTRAGALENEEVDITYNLIAETRSSFYRDDDFDVSAAPGSGYTFMQLPVNVEPWDDERVRRAFNHLIPRTEITESIFDGWAVEAWVPLAEVAAANGTTDYDQLMDDLREYNEYDPERAQELIDEAGVETPIEVTVYTNSDNQDRVNAVELVVESMNQSELFDANLETPGDISTLVETIQVPEFQEEGAIAVVGLSGTYNPDSFVTAVHHPDNYLQCCNYQNIDFPELTEASEDALFGVDVAEDPDLRRERYDEVWRLLLEINANSFIEYELTTATYNSNVVKGFNMASFPESMLSYGLYAPQDEHITYVDRD